MTMYAYVITQDLDTGPYGWLFHGEHIVKIHTKAAAVMIQ